MKQTQDRHKSWDAGREAFSEEGGRPRTLHFRFLNELLGELNYRNWCSTNFDVNQAMIDDKEATAWPNAEHASGLAPLPNLPTDL